MDILSFSCNDHSIEGIMLYALSLDSLGQANVTLASVALREIGHAVFNFGMDLPPDALPAYISDELGSNTTSLPWTREKHVFRVIVFILIGFKYEDGDLKFDLKCLAAYDQVIYEPGSELAEPRITMRHRREPHRRSHSWFNDKVSLTGPNAIRLNASRG